MRLVSGSITRAIFLRRAEYAASRLRADLTLNFVKVDGTVVIFDIETNGVARKLRGHTRQVQSLRYLSTRCAQP